MDAREAKNLVYELLRLFFAGAAVTFSKQSNTVRPSAPLVTLTTVSLKRPLYPPQKIVDGIPVSYYPTRMRMQADLYTKGAPVDTDPGYLMPMENTALSDLTEFSNFLGSEYVVNWCHRHDVALWGMCRTPPPLLMTQPLNSEQRCSWRWILPKRLWDMWGFSVRPASNTVHSREMFPVQVSRLSPPRTTTRQRMSTSNRSLHRLPAAGEQRSWQRNPSATLRKPKSHQRRENNKWEITWNGLSAYPSI